MARSHSCRPPRCDSSSIDLQIRLCRPRHRPARSRRMRGALRHPLALRGQGPSWELAFCLRGCGQGYKPTESTLTIDLLLSLGREAVGACCDVQTSAGPAFIRLVAKERAKTGIAIRARR